MKKLLILLLAVLCLPYISPAQKSCVSRNGDIIRLENSLLAIDINLKKVCYDVMDKKAGMTILKNAYISPAGWNTKSRQTNLEGNTEVEWKQKEVTADGQKGICVELDITSHKRANMPVYLFAFTLYEDASWIQFQCGLKNNTGRPGRLSVFYPFFKAELFPKLEMTEFRTLNGASGNEHTSVEEFSTRECTNSMLMTGKVNGKRYSMIWGGLKYENFYATASLDAVKRTVSLKMSDPVGRAVDNGETFWSPDTYYLGMGAADPFDISERYGMAMRKANNADPKIYNFIKLCGWAVGALSHQGNVNNSADLVKEMDYANESGLTRFVKVGIRIVPDRYCYIDGDTEQGWWDDEHWAKYKHLVPPYETNAKWCAAIKKRGGLPITYLQTNIPSCDFALAHPEWMIGNDISRLDQNYSHVAPTIKYDYTDKEFQKYMHSVWTRLHSDGIAGVFFDYPETSWITTGGFEDRKATTTSAYREIFKIARGGIGYGAYFSERNIGESKRPMLDITAGLVDYQRTTWDTNKYQADYISKCGLRWYKGRLVFNYYQDSKEISTLSTEIRQSMLSMITMTSGQLELATSFKKLTPEMTYDLSRIYPMYDGLKSPRPIDAFTGVKDPMIYDLDLTPDYHVVTLFNPTGNSRKVEVSLKDERVDGGLALDQDASYYAYDFWGKKLAGVFSGKDRLGKELNSMACAVYALRKVENNPQVISTDRHILQGWMDMKDLEWDNAAGELSAVSDIVEGDVYRITVALNGYKAVSVKSATGNARVSLKKSPEGEGYRIIEISSPKSQKVEWHLKCRK